MPSGRCTDVPRTTTTNGTQVQLWDCHGGANQQWNVNTDGTITNALNNLCLDASGWGSTNGTKLHPARKVKSFP